MWVAARPRPAVPRPAPPPVEGAPTRWVGYVVVVALSFVVTYVTDYNWPTRTGNLCILLFVAANTYVPVKFLRRRFHWKGVQVYFTWLIRWHCWLNTAAFVSSCVHCYTTSWTNDWLWLSLGLMGLLTANGFLLRFKYPPRVRKGLYVLHTQQAAFFLLLYALLKGHYVFLWLP